MGERLVFRKYKGPEWAWPSITFAIRWPIGRALRVDQPSDCPLAGAIARRYWWVRWAGLGVGAWPMVEATLTNRSAEAIHSFVLRFVARAGGHASGTGARPEGGLWPGAQCSQTIQEPGPVCVAVCVDFVQFISGDVWYSATDESLVTETGVQAGARAAVDHMVDVLARSGASVVMAQLARVHADVVEPVTNPRYGAFGFYSGVANVAVRLQSAYERDGLRGVEILLRSLATEPA